MLRLSQKLLLFVLAAAVIPLAFAGFWLLREAERELGLRLEREQRALASAAAEATGNQLAISLESLAQTALLIDWAKVTGAEAQGGLRLLCSQSAAVVAATLVDPHRPELSPLVDDLEGRPEIKVSRDVLARLLPLQKLATWGQRGQVALGSVQDSAGGLDAAAIRWAPRGLRLMAVLLT